MVTDLLAGRRLAGAMVNIVPPGGVANAVAIFTQSTFAQMLGTKTLKLKKVRWRSNAVGAQVWLHIGTGVGAGFLDLIPPIRTLNNMDGQLMETELPSQEAAATITAYPDAFAAGSFDIGVEVEEIG